MYTTDNKNKAKKKYTHPPMEDSRKLEDFSKLEDFEYLEYSKNMIDYDAIMDRITGVSPNSKLRVKLGDEKEMLLPLNNYEIRIKVEDLGYEKSVRIRAENLSTGEVETYIDARPVPNYRMCASTPYRQNFGKNDSKNEMQRNSRTQYFQDYGHKNKSFTIHVTSYKEPELISNDDISWLNDWWNTNGTYTTKGGIIDMCRDGGGNENHFASNPDREIVHYDELFPAFRAAIAGISLGYDPISAVSSICDLINNIFSELTKREEVKATPYKRVNKQAEDKRDNAGEVLDVEYGKGKYSNWKRFETQVGREYKNETEDSLLTIDYKGDSLLWKSTRKGDPRKDGRYIIKLSDKK